MNKQERNEELAASGSPQHDEELFASKQREKRQRRIKKIKKIAIAAGVVAAVLMVAVLILRRQVRERFAFNNGEVLSATVERGTVSTVVSGSGTLENLDTETVYVPTGVEIKEILAEYGDSLEQGELIATVDLASVRSAMAELQSQIDELDTQISQAEGDTVSSYISAGVSGRVKAIYAQTDMSVAETMVEHGALALLSLDGYMAVDIQGSDLAAGEQLTVELSDGSELPGLVESVTGDTATVLLSDNGPALEEEVLLLDAQGEELGRGKLYIHSPLAVTGYAGRISAVYVELDQKVSASGSLFALTETSTDILYESLLQSRREAEAQLMELLEIQQLGGLGAPIEGTVYSVLTMDELEAAEETEEGKALAVLAPDVSMAVTITVDEGDILSLALDQTASVTVSSVSDESFDGTVTEIDKTASDGSYTATVCLDKTEGMLPGMSAEVDIRIEGVDDALLIPAQALHQSSSGYYVYTSYDENSGEYGDAVDVVPGLSNSSYVEIKSGLAEGDTVYYTQSSSYGVMPFGEMGGQRGNFGGNEALAGERPELGMNGAAPAGTMGGEMPAAQPQDRN